MMSHQHQPRFSKWNGLDLIVCVCITCFMIVDLFRDILNYDTWVFVYALANVMCLCEYDMSTMYVV